MRVASRRTFLCGAVAALASGAGLYAGVIEPGWLSVTRLDLPLRRWPDAFAGFTIAQVSDLHFGPFIRPKHIDAAVDRVLALNPDAVVITGDLVSRVTHGEPDMIVQSLSRLRAPQGVFAVLGNHDWWSGAAVVTRALRCAGITVLANTHHAWQRGGQRLYLAGVDDVWCRKHDLAAALEGIPADGAVVTLVHEPDYADEVAGEPRVCLQLSGHSHGGQVCVPFGGALRLPSWGRKYPRGLYRVRDLTLYTNRGLGVVNWPFRFACRPEVTLFTLRPAPALSRRCHSGHSAPSATG
jgi:predicted MPP superfamily phosphohydrolase